MTPPDVLAGIAALLDIGTGRDDPGCLATRCTEGPVPVIAPAVVRAAGPMVEAHLEALDKPGFQVPAGWRELRSREVARGSGPVRSAAAENSSSSGAASVAARRRGAGARCGYGCRAASGEKINEPDNLGRLISLIHTLRL